MGAAVIYLVLSVAVCAFSSTPEDCQDTTEDCRNWRQSCPYRKSSEICPCGFSLQYGCFLSEPKPKNKACQCIVTSLGIYNVHSRCCGTIVHCNQPTTKACKAQGKTNAECDQGVRGTPLVGNCNGYVNDTTNQNTRLHGGALAAAGGALCLDQQGGFTPGFQQGGQIGGFPGGQIGGFPGGQIGGFPGGQIGGLPVGQIGGFPGGQPGGGATCRRWCRTPQGQAYCCEGGNQPLQAAVTKPGQCPPVRPSCPPTRGGPPKQCSSDGGCAGTNKYCFDTCLQHHTCKPPIGLGKK